MMLILIAVLIACLTFGAGILALHAQKRLLDAGKSDTSRALIGQVSGLVSLLLAMVLGTLIGTSFGFYFAQKASLDTFAAQILEFDQALAQYGPETKPARDRLKEAVVRGYNLFWGQTEADSAALSVAAPLAQELATNSYLASLQPTSEIQRQALARANQIAAAEEQSRLLMSLQVAGQSVPWQLVLILTIWAVALFLGYGLFAPNNAITIGVLGFGALSIALAMFLIFDLRQPYNGVFRISPAALEEAIQALNK